MYTELRTYQVQHNEDLAGSLHLLDDAGGNGNNVRIDDGRSDAHDDDAEGDDDDSGNDDRDAVWGGTTMLMSTLKP